MAEPDESLWAYFHRASAGFWNLRRRPLLPVLVFDQFEEVFTLGQESEASRSAVQAFLNELADLVEDRPSEALSQALDRDPAHSAAIDFERRGCKLLLSFREDFLPDVEGLRARIPSLMRNRFRLLPMDAAQAREVIASGGELVGPAVAERIIGLAWRNQAVSVAFSSDSTRLASASSDENVILWELQSQRPLATLAGHKAEVNSVVFTPDGKRLVSGGNDQTVRVWDLDPAHLLEQACQTAGRNLSCSEWRTTFGRDQPYRPTCPAFAPPAQTCMTTAARR